MNNKSLNINYILLIIYVCILSCVCTGSSPLLDYMDPDSQNFWLIGRSMAAGQIAYVDIFDHKGPYIFFINALGALISSNSTIGLFILEIIANSVSIVMAFKLSNIILNDDKKSILSAMAYIGISFNYFTYVTGNLTETWTMCFQLITLYCIVKYYYSENIEHPPVYMFVHGLTACIVGFMRPNNAGMWFPFAIILAYRLFKNKRYINFFKNLLALVLGVIVGVVPLTIYGVKYNCFEEIWFGTFEANYIYSVNNKNTNNILNFLKTFVTKPAFIIIVLCIISLIIVAKNLKERDLKITYILMFLTTLVFMNLSLRCDGQYYHLNMVFVLPLVISFFNNFGDKIKVYLWICAIVFATLVVNLQLIKQITKYGNYHYYHESALEMKEIMDENPGDKVMVTGCNSVFYNVTNTLPHIKYFIIYGYGLSQGVFDEPTIQQANSIISCENDYVITLYKDEDRSIIYNLEELDSSICETLNSNYEEVFVNDEINLVMYSKRR